tara:strand:- start:5156 stop:5386 length:231 start_codon:yes stop_codon:yes gene_type:complete
MKYLIGFSMFIILGFSACIEEGCKTCSITITHDDVVQEQLTTEIDYCDAELLLIENTAPIIQTEDDYTIITTTTCE